MAAGNYDFTIEQGATLDLPIFFKDGDGVALDYTGYTARMQVRQNVSSSAVLLELTTENGRLILDGPEGNLTLLVTAEDTADITWRKGVYDIEMVAPDDTVTRVLQGTITISLEVTRD